MTISKESLHESIANQRQQLLQRIAEPMRRLAEKCNDVWGDREKLDELLLENFDTIPNRTFLYALGPAGVQLTDNVSSKGLLAEDFGRDRSSRPYMKQLNLGIEFVLSEAYLSIRKDRPSLTAIQSIFDDAGNLKGYLGADFDLRDLPLTGQMYTEPQVWQQIKGDPSIRQGVFSQQRVESALDKNIDTITSVLKELMLSHGVFHFMLHFSSSRAVIWQFEDPYQYRLLNIDALTDPDICLAFPQTPYPNNAVIPKNKIGEILEALRQLRFMDETLYLRTGTVNIFNGLIGLTFSCDGSHYIPWQEFLNKEHVFWSSGAVVSTQS